MESAMFLSKVNVYLDNNDITEYVLSLPVLNISKSNGNTSLYLDINQFSLENSSSYFTPTANNSIWNIEDYSENRIRIEYDGKPVLDDPVRKVDLRDNGNTAIVETMPELTRFLDSVVDYASWVRGNPDLTFPTSEYSLINGYYFETPAMAVKHLLIQVGVDEDYIDSDTFTLAHNEYVSNSCYIEIFANQLDLTLIRVLNLISEKCQLYLYRDTDGLIKFQHGFYSYNESVSLSADNMFNINNLTNLSQINDYYIEYDGYGWETDSDNNDIGLPYRNINRRLEITDDIIKVADSTSSIYLGELAIKKNYIERKGFSIPVNIDYFQNITMFSEIKLNYFRYGWTDKIVEPFKIGLDILNNQLKLDFYEVLKWE